MIELYYLIGLSKVTEGGNMSANLFGERFLGHREPAWHGLGKTFNTELSASEAVIKGGLNFNVIKAPLIAYIEGANALTGKYGIFREPTPDDPEYRYLGIGAPTYSILQNIDIARIVDPLTDLWPVETAGALGVGETLFLTLDAGDDEVKGEHIRKFFLITDTKDGGTSLKIAFTPIRVVCQNTLISGLRDSIVSDAINHNSNTKDILSARVDMLQKMQHAIKETMASFDALASAVIEDDEAKVIFEAAYPNPKKSAKMNLLAEFDDTSGPLELGLLYDKAKGAEESYNYWVNKAQELRDGAFRNYERICDEHNSIANTPWAAYNSVVEFADFRGTREDTAKSALFGLRANEKKRAFAKALEYIQ